MLTHFVLGSSAAVLGQGQLHTPTLPAPCPALRQEQGRQSALYSMAAGVEIPNQLSGSGEIPSDSVEIPSPAQSECGHSQWQCGDSQSSSVRLWTFPVSVWTFPIQLSQSVEIPIPALWKLS